MAEVVDEGHISGYKYAVLHRGHGEYIWWAERPGGTTCWRGNTHAIPASVEEAKEQIKAAMAQYGVGAEDP
jgi:hypothetical protein